MKQTGHLADQIDSAYLNGGWVVVSLRDLFRSLSFSEASAHPIAGAHSAWEIALHLTFWHDAVRRRLAGETVEYEPEEDWPTPEEHTESAWTTAISELERSHRELVQSVRVLNPEMLNRPVAERDFTVSFMLRGVPEHDLYHGGQVVMLKKAAGGPAT